MTPLPQNFSASPSKPPLVRLQKWVLAILLASLVFAVFENTLSNGFVFDDASMIRNNPAIRDVKHVKLYFVRPFFSVGQPTTGPVEYDYYRPMVLVSYLADYLVWGLMPWGYHLSNIFLHVAATLLVFLLLTKLKLNAAASFIAAILFAVHPALADSVAGVSGRSDPLCAVFFLTSIYFYICARQEGPHKGGMLLFWSHGAFVLALLSKENAIALPVVLTAYEFIRPDGAAGEKLGVKAKPLLPSYLIAFAYFLWRSQIVPGAGSIPGDNIELAHRLMTAAQVAVSYIFMMCFPHGLGFETFTPMLKSFMAPEAILAVAVLFIVLGTAVLTLRRSPRVSFFICWFFACLLPFSYFFLFHPEPSFFTPPHFLYFPAIGLAALWGLTVVGLAQSGLWRAGSWRRRAFLASQAMIILFFCAQTIRRNTEWQNDFTFFSAMVKHAPQSSRIHIGMANAFLNAGRPGSALTEYAKAYELGRRGSNEQAAAEQAFPRGINGEAEGRLVITNYYAAAALAGMGDSYRMMGETANSIRSYKTALRENAFDATIHLKLARTYERAGNFDDAIAGYERALRLDRNLSEAASSLQLALVKKEVYDQAKRVYLTARLSRQEGSADALYGEAVMLRLSGKQEAAAALLREAVEKTPTHFGANLALGQILSERGDHEEALGNFSVAYADRPTSPLVAYELALTNLALGDTLAAVLWAAKTYELEPSAFNERFLDEVKACSEEGTRAEK